MNRSICHTVLETLHDTTHVDARCSIGDKTALHLAVEHGKAELVEELVKGGADCNIRDAAGQTAADCARTVFAQDAEMMKRMLEWVD